MEQLKGVVVKSTGSWYTVKSKDGKICNCVIKGSFRIKELKTTNPVAVGDFVSIEYDKKTQIGNIYEIHPRTNYLIRKSRKLSSRYHILASNLNMAALIVTINYPKTSMGFIDRFLVNCEAYNIQPLIIFNKTDIYKIEDLEKLKFFRSVYQSIEYQCIAISAKTGDRLDDLKKILEGKTTLFTGHSGSGKTTLLNSLNPLLKQKTAELSIAWKKGKHTTTFAEMHELWEKTNVIDTPGIKDMELINMEPKESALYMPDICRFAKSCKFNNCEHTNEPECAVKEAVEKELIHSLRYKSYLSMLKNEDSFS